MTTKTAYISLRDQDLPDGTHAAVGEEIPPGIAAELPDQWFEWGYVGLKAVTGPLPQAKKRPKPPAPVTVVPRTNTAKPTHCPDHPAVPPDIAVAEPDGRTTTLHTGEVVPTVGWRLWTSCGAAECHWHVYEDFKNDRATWWDALTGRLAGRSPNAVLARAGIHA